LDTWQLHDGDLVEVEEWHYVLNSEAIFAAEKCIFGFLDLNGDGDKW